MCESDIMLPVDKYASMLELSEYDLWDSEIETEEPEYDSEEYDET
jgi:hypothetical protein